MSPTAASDFSLKQKSPQTVVLFIISYKNDDYLKCTLCLWYCTQHALHCLIH
jgi:hypothetical protein